MDLKIMTNAIALKKRMKGAELLTPKQRVFAEYFVSHYPKGTKKEAALHAGYSEKTCEKVGSLLTNPNKNPHVVAYIERLRDSASKQYKDHLRHLRRLDHLSLVAEDKGQLAAAINSEFRLGQSVGLYVDKKEIKVVIPVVARFGIASDRPDVTVDSPIVMTPSIFL